jgi:abequosyltransferase
MPIDILIPTFQRADSLLENLEHMLLRMREEGVEEHFRIIISDNASTDGTEAAVRALMARANEQRALVSYHRNERNLGLECNAVVVAKLATSEFVLWCGDDDFFADGYLRFIVESIAAHPSLGCVIPGLALLRRDGSLEVGRNEDFEVRHFAAGYSSVHELSHLAHQMSGLLFRRAGLLEEYLARPECRNPYLFIYFASNRLLRHDALYAPKFKTRVTVFNERAWGYNSIGLLDEVFKNYAALRPSCTDREVDDLMLRFLVMHSYRLAFQPASVSKLAGQLVKIWKAGSRTLYFKRRVGIFFLRELAAGMTR